THVFGWEQEDISRIKSVLDNALPDQKREKYQLALYNFVTNDSDYKLKWKNVLLITKSGENKFVNITCIKISEQGLLIFEIQDTTAYNTNLQKLDIAIQGGRLGTWNLNLQTEQNEVNEYWASMLGYSLEEVNHHLDFFNEKLSDESKETFKKKFDEVKSGERESYSFDIQMQCKDGSYKWLLTSGRIIRRDAMGKPLIMAGIHVDIDNLKKSESLVREKELNLYEAREKLDIAIQGGRLGTWNLNLETGKNEVNQYWAEMLGYTVEEVESNFNFFMEHLHPESAALIQQSLGEVMSGKCEDVSFEIQMLCKNGKYKWILDSGRVIKKDKNGKPLIMAGTHVDIDDIKAVELQLREKEERLSQSQAIGEIGDWEWNPETGETTWSDQVYKIFERDPKLGAPSLDEFIHYHEPNEYELLQKSVQKALKAKETYEYDTTLHLASGKKHVKAIGIPVLDDEGNIVKLKGIVQNITPRKQMELALLEKEEYLDSILQNASDAILACDAEGKLVLFNNTLRQWIDDVELYTNANSWPGKYKLYTTNLERLLNKEELSLMIALKEGKVSNHEYAIKQKNDIRYVESNGTALYDDKEKIIGAMVVIRDITDRVDRDLQISNSILDALEKERAAIAAELHDGITQTLGIVNMNLKNISIDDPALKQNDRFSRSQKQLEIAINESRALAHRIMPSAIRDFGLAMSIQELTDDYHTSEKVSIDFSFNEDIRLPADIELNTYRIAQEAINNAIKHGQPDHIKVDLKIKEGYLIMIIEDNGKGFQLDDTKQEGIGLRTMQNRANKLNAQLNIESGVSGTILSLRIPLP
ncbi:PAS domain S-box protein, partial [Fulvivirga sp. RKSG066]|uniref:PAS domain-containing protein n=1 Tax=Fulvivirga aurantia TaxID=2529383 RepID=UPI0012BB7FB8